MTGRKEGVGVGIQRSSCRACLSYQMPANNSSHLSSPSSARYVLSRAPLSLVILTTALERAGDSHLDDGETEALRDGVIYLKSHSQ